MIERFPADPLAAAARYELALIARRHGRNAESRRHLELLAQASPEPALREPVRYLLCRLELEAGGEAAAAVCYSRFRADFPASAHDDDVLAWLAIYVDGRAGCPGAEPLYREYLRRYPRGRVAGRARARLTECGGGAAPE